MRPMENDDKLVVCITGDIDHFKVETNELMAGYFSILKKNNITATFFVTAKAAENFPERVENILKCNHVVEGHGDVHEGFLESESVQVKRLISMKETFSRLFNLDIEGFRAPWYRHNNVTYSAVDRAGLKYDCSKKRFEIAFKGIPIVQEKYMYTAAYPYLRPILKLVASLYNIHSRSPRTPYHITSNVVEFPTLGISDYTLISDPRGPKYSPDNAIKIGEIWTECLNSLKKRGGGVLTLQAHPCRMSPGYLEGLDYFIQQAMKLRVVFSTPREILMNSQQ